MVPFLLLTQLVTIPEGMLVTMKLATAANLMAAEMGLCHPGPLASDGHLWRVTEADL